MQHITRILFFGMATIVFTTGQQAKAQGVIETLLSGQPVVVRLDNCNAAHLGDPQSTLACGHDYTLQYPNTSNWCSSVSGFDAYNQRMKGAVVYCDPNPNENPKNHYINLWGRVMTYDDNGQVFDRDPPHPLVGHLVAVGTPAPGGQASGRFAGECLCNYHSEIFSCGNSGVLGSSCQDVAAQCARKTNGHGQLGRCYQQ